MTVVVRPVNPSLASRQKLGATIHVHVTVGASLRNAVEQALELLEKELQETRNDK